MKKFIFLYAVFFFAGLKYGLAQDSLYRTAFTG